MKIFFKAKYKTAPVELRRGAPLEFVKVDDKRWHVVYFIKGMKKGQAPFRTPVRHVERIANK